MRHRGLLLALWWLPSSSVLAASIDVGHVRSDEPQEILVEVAIGSLARRTVLAFEHEEQVLLPAVEFFDLIELPMAVDDAGRLSGVRYPEGVPLFLDALTRTASAGDSTWNIEPSAAIWRVDRLYIAVPVLSQLLDVRFHVDWAKLRITVTNPGQLPIARRIQRERARHAASSPYGRTPDRRLGLERPGWDGAVLDWGLYYPGGSPVERTAVRAGLGLNVLGGSLEFEYREFNQASDRTTASWLGVWPERQSIRQFGLGDVIGSGPRPGRVRGFLLTNSPFVRPASFDRDLLSGDLPAGWEIELYQSGRLVDYAEPGPDGAYLLEAPLAYGPNPLELRAYGPYGQMQIWERTLPVEPDRLPAGVFEYGLAAGQCRNRVCETTANLDLRYGVSRALTLRGGLETFGRDTFPDLFQPYASASGTIASRWIVRGEAVWRGLVGGDLIYAPTPDFRVGVRAAWFDTHISAPVLTPRDREREFRAFGFWRPDRRRRTLYLEALVFRLDNARSRYLFARLGGSYQVGIIRWMGGARREATEASGGSVARTIVDLAASANLHTPDAPALDRLFLRTGIEMSRRGFERFEWSASRPLVGANRLDARISWRRGTREPFVSLGVTAFLPGARTISQLSRTPESRVQAAALAEGSVIWDGQIGRLNAAPERSLRRGGLGGVVFLDANGNGRYDGADAPLDSVRVQVGPYTLYTDEYGRFGIWDLVPFIATDVALDSMSLRNPLWTPAFKLATVVVGPNSVRHLDIPVVPAAEVTGNVILRMASGPRPVAGLRLQFVNRQDGRRFGATTFSDGEFYLLGLPPGDYEVSIPEDARRAFGVRAADSELRFSVTLADGWAQAPFLAIELVPASSRQEP
jgi:hypothetical protein